MADNGHEEPPDEGMEILETEGAGGTDLVPVDSEVSTQIATAKRFPRSIARATKTALSLVTLNEETAAACLYTLKRGGKAISGPSARFAEAIASAWGNNRFGARVMGHNDKDVRAQGMCWDLENNTACSIEVRRRITDRNGRTYNDDMIVVTGNAANSIALRNAVLKVVPGAWWKPIFEKARQCAFGNVKTLASRRQSMVEYFGKLGIEPERIAAAVGKEAVEDIGLEEIELLIGLSTALKEGDTTIEEAFPPEPGAEGGGGKPQPQRKSQAKPAAAVADAPRGAAAPPAQAAPEAGEQRVNSPRGAENAAPEKPLPPEPEDPAGVVAKPKGNGGGKKDFKIISEIVALMPQIDAKSGEKGAAKAMMEELYSVDTAIKLDATQAGEWLEKLRQILSGGGT
jgi:hypothetical protein